MRVSLNIIKQFIGFELPPVDELVAKINAQLGGVEEVIDLGVKYKDAKIVRVVECEKHPNADKLSVCKIDAGTGELIQVVCGAPNAHADMWGVWLPPESIVPASFHDIEPFILGAREIRGEVSNGMLASAKELAIGDDHSGIVDIADSDLLPGTKLIAGASFAEIFGLNDTIIDIENKMFTHRPDLFGQIGVAREIAGIFHQKFTSPSWYIGEPELGEAKNSLELEVFNDAPENSPRFMAVAIKDIKVTLSPLWLRCALVAMGGKPINNIVDATNYIMLLTAQPTHAYDYDKIRGGRLGVRMAKDGESVPLLNGKTYTLISDDIVITDSEGAIGLAGIMGGGNSEVTADTKNIVLEVANFDMYTLRKSSMRHGLFTDALTRFNKGQSPRQNDHILSLLMMSIQDVAGGEQASEVYDLGGSERFTDDAFLPETTQITNTFINERLGLHLQNSEVKELLENVEIKVDSPDHNTRLHIYPPFWRTDIELPEDIVEEVGRLYGYNQLPRELPARSAKPAPKNPYRDLAQSVRENLARAGASEVLTYSFVHKRVISSAGQDSGDAYQLSNALSPDLQYYRLSLTPSLLDRIHANSKAGYDEFALFEIGKSHSKKAGYDEDGLPLEPRHLALVFVSKNLQDNTSFYRAKAFLEFLSFRLGLEFFYEPLGDLSSSPTAAPFEPKRSAIVTDKKSGRYVGLVGEYKKAVSSSFKLPEHVAGFEVDMMTMLALTEQVENKYRPLSRYPSVDRDISLQVSASLLFGEVQGAMHNALKNTNLDTAVSPVSIYYPENGDTKNFAFRITFTSHEKTLTSDEVNNVVERIVGQLETAIGAKLV